MKLTRSAAIALSVTALAAVGHPAGRARGDRARRRAAG